jgi:tetratricopeptide (TPR) repeat protein
MYKSKYVVQKLKPSAYEKRCLEVYNLARKGEYLAVISLIKHPRSWRLKNDFRSNANHSWYMVGCAYYDLYKYELGIRSFRKAVRSWSEDGEAWAQLGYGYSELGRFYSAYRANMRGIKSESNRKVLPALYYNLGNVLFDMKKYSAAAEIYKKLIRRRDEVGRRSRKNLKLATEWIVYLKEEQHLRASRRRTT